MKRLILVFCLMFIASIVSAQDLAIWEGKDGTAGYYKEVKCEICGKLLREWVETEASSFFISDGDITITSGAITNDTVFVLDGSTWTITTKPQAPKPLEKAKFISISKHLTVCGHCEKIFHPILRNAVTNTYNKWFEQAVIESTDRIKIMQEQAKEYHLQALRKELADFKREMQEKIKQMEEP